MNRFHRITIHNPHILVTPDPVMLYDEWPQAHKDHRQSPERPQ